ncbi:MAG TPA: prolipoprotein diacylglyceryl transferase [Acidimicrobiales bacterium]|nr:prolipoprotein diacylglyceryl transferase [Acidimicrobiales bacterium]
MLGAISYDPIVNVDIGPLSISPHGVGIAVGFLLGARLMLPTTRRQGIADDVVYALLTRAAIGAVIGARLAYVANHIGDYDSIVEPFKVWEGGISLLGGFFGAILLAMPEVRKHKLDFWKVMDAAAPGMALGVVVGRIGDLVVADHLGKPTDFFLGYRCPPPDVETASPCLGEVVHQTALYDLLMTSVLLAALLLLRRRPRYPGFLISVFGVWYGVQRVIEDFLREDTRHLGDTLTGSQITSIVTILVAGWHLLFVRRSPRWGHWEEPVDPVPEEEVAAPTMAAPDGPAEREEP